MATSLASSPAASKSSPLLGYPKGPLGRRGTEFQLCGLMESSLASLQPVTSHLLHFANRCWKETFLL